MTVTPRTPSARGRPGRPGPRRQPDRQGRRHRRRHRPGARPGEVVGLVGESGSGKTTVGTSLLDYSRAGAFISSGKVLLEDRDVLRLPWKEVRQAARRGDRLRAAGPGVRAQPGHPDRQADRRAAAAARHRHRGVAAAGRARRSGRGRPAERRRVPQRYAHQLSGGQVQRVALAMAFLPKPKVLVLDEPTTGLDVTTQKMVLDTMAELCRAHGVSALYVTHDLAVVANIADRVAVMYAGQIAELGPRDAIFANPSHPYTRALLDSIPHLSQARALKGIPGRTPAPGAPPERLPVQRPLHVRDRRVPQGGCPSCAPSRPSTTCAASAPSEIGTWDIYRGTVPDADPDKPRDVILSVERPQRLLRPQAGRLRRELRPGQGRGRGPGRRVRQRQDHDLPVGRWPAQGLDRHDHLRGRELSKSARKRNAEDRRRMQYIFQNPYLSLNPRLTIEQIVKRPMELFGSPRARRPPTAWSTCMDQVALGPRMLHYQASRLSGGERQRVAIARALAAEPDVLICDEITSALDVSVQGSIVALLEGLRQRARHQHAVRDPQPRPGALDRRPRRDPPGRQGRRGRLGRDGDGDAVARSTPASCSPTARGSTDTRGRHLRVPVSGSRPSPTPSTSRGGRHVGRPGGDPRELPSAHRDLDVDGRRRRPRRAALEEWLDETSSTSLVVVDERHGGPRVVRRRAGPRHAVPRRLDDQVGARPPGRPGGPRRRAGA